MRVSRRKNQLTYATSHKLELYVKGLISVTLLKNYPPVQRAVSDGLTQKMNNFIRYHRRYRRKMAQK